MLIVTGLIWLLHVFNADSSALNGISDSCNLRARAIVEQFAAYDYAGYMLDSKGHEAIWKLTNENGNPPGGETVTKSFHVVSVKRRGNECKATIRYRIYGTFAHESLVFHPHSGFETQTMFLKCDFVTCRIELDYSKFRIPSHPGKVATLQWLRRLKDMQATSSERDSVSRVWHRIAQLK